MVAHQLAEHGFTAADIGRHIRLFSQPAQWVSGTTYAIGNLVTYNDTFWQSLINSNTGVTPGTNVADWVPVSGTAYALWTWGRITGISGSGLVVPVTAIGTMTHNGGLAAAFDGVVAKTFASSAASASVSTEALQSFVANTSYAVNTLVYGNNGVNYECLHTFTALPNANGTGSNQYYLFINTGEYWSYFTFPPTDLGGQGVGNTNMWQSLGNASASVVDTYVGQHYSSPQAIQQATIFPSSNNGFANNVVSTIVINLRASLTAPTKASGGTLLGSQRLTADQSSSRYHQFKQCNYDLELRLV